MGDIRLTEQEIDQARVAFLEFDKDNSGSIDQVCIGLCLVCADRSLHTISSS